MTECTRKPLQFSSLSRKKIFADFAGGHLTSNGGALLLREANRRTGLIDALAECITDPRQPAKIKHDIKTMLAQRICGIALGYEDGNDHQTRLNGELFTSLTEAKVVTEDFRLAYNHRRPHSSLGYETPAAYAAKVGGLPAGGG